jgi:hypothetical protein
MDLLEQLAEVSVPPVPAAAALTAGVRRKLHPRLLGVHLAEFACGAMGWAAWHFCTAVFAALRFTLTGSWPRGHEGADRDH